MGLTKDESLPNLEGYIVIVTGGNSGIGYETALQLALRGARVYIAARSKSRIINAIAQMKESARKELDLESLSLDLGSLNSVDSAVKSFIKAESRLDILINNAGVCSCSYF